MAKKKKVNPNRRPATVADVRRAKKQGETNSLTVVWAIFFRTMRDKEGYGTARLQRLWSECRELADAIASGEVKVQDIVDSLRDEDGIYLS